MEKRSPIIHSLQQTQLKQWYRNTESKKKDKYTKCNEDKVDIFILISNEVDFWDKKPKPQIPQVITYSVHRKR